LVALEYFITIIHSNKRLYISIIALNICNFNFYVSKFIYEVKIHTTRLLISNFFSLNFQAFEKFVLYDVTRVQEGDK